MKLNKIFVIGLMIILANGCIQKGYFKTPNDMYQTDALVNLINGEKRVGKITVLFESELKQVDYITLYNNKVTEKILLIDIDYFEIKNNVYFPKYVALPNTDLNRLLFLKLLNKRNQKMQIFELYFQRNINTNEIERYFYFVATKAQSRFQILSIIKPDLVPNFEIKMAAVVKDCPLLASKISTRTKNYFIPSITFSNEKTLQTLQNIAKEYADCK